MTASTTSGEESNPKRLNEQGPTCVVVLPFLFSDLSRKKLRPALLLAESEFVEGGLQRVSYLRPGKLFTCHESLPVNTVGALNKASLQQARAAVIQMIQGG